MAENNSLHQDASSQHVSYLSLHSESFRPPQLHSHTSLKRVNNPSSEHQNQQRAIKPRALKTYRMCSSYTHNSPKYQRLLLLVTLKLIRVPICCQSDLLGQIVCSDLHIKLDLFSTFCKPVVNTHRKQTSWLWVALKGTSKEYIQIPKT